MTSERNEHLIEIEGLPRGENAEVFNGEDHGAQVSFFLSHNRPDTGPELHRHPYEEVFIVEEGRVRFTLDDQTVEANAGDILVVPPGTPHKFTAVSTPHLQISIHPVARMETEWLE